MKRCQYCGTQLNDEMDFCTECGRPVSMANTPYTSSPNAYNPNLNYDYEINNTYREKGDDVYPKEKAIASLCCGIGSFFIAGIILGIIAIVLANLSKKETGGRYTSYAKAGLICGIVGLVLAVISIVFLAMFTPYFSEFLNEFSGASYSVV